MHEIRGAPNPRQSGLHRRPFESPGEWLETLLRMHRVTSLADVRSSPYSRFNPQFNRKALAESLRRAGIAYEFLGRELGGRSDDPGDYAEGRIRYDRLVAKPDFEIGLERLLRHPPNERTALLCAEKEPLDLPPYPAGRAGSSRTRHSGAAHPGGRDSGEPRPGDGPVA